VFSTGFHLRVLPVLPLIVLATARAVHAQAPPEAELKDAEQLLASALVAKDAEAFERLLAADFVLRGAPDVTRSVWIDNALKLCWGDRFEIGDFRVARALPDMAVVTLVLTTSRDPKTCEPATIRSLLTDVWRREQDGWRLALRHSGPATGSVDTQFEKIEPPPPMVEGSAELSLVSTGGNSDTESLGLGSSIIWRPGRWTTQGQVSFIRSETAGIETARSLAASVRQGRTITPRLDAFGRLEYLSDEFAGIETRATIDGGVGYKAIDDSIHTLLLDLGLGYSHEARVAGADQDSALANLAGTYLWRLHRSSSIESASLFTASLDRAGDWRFRNSLALTAAMTRTFSLKLSHSLK